MSQSSPHAAEGGRDFQGEANQIRNTLLTKGILFGRWTQGQLSFLQTSFDSRCFTIEDNYGLSQIAKALENGQDINLE